MEIRQPNPAELDLFNELIVDESDGSGYFFTPDLSRVIYAFDGDDPVGAIELGGPTDPVYINLLYVLESHRNRLIGSRLVDHALFYARKHGAKVLRVHSSLNAERFYQQYGFVRVGSSTLFEYRIKGRNENG